MRAATLAEPRNRPFLALGAGLLLLGFLLAIAPTRAWLAETVAEPLRAQADPAPRLNEGYSIPSLAFWAALGGLLAWALYELLFVRLGVEPDLAFFAGLSPLLLFGPLFHALLVAGAIPHGTPMAYLATEPPIYLTTALLAALALLAGRATRQKLWAPLGVGLLCLAPLVVLAAPLVQPASLRHVGAILALALLPAALLAFLFVRLRPETAPLPSALAVTAAHALDGATTWMVLRDPFGLGFEEFGERNPVSLVLVSMANGWLYYAVKLALPLVLLAILKTEDDEPRLRAFLLFAVFVLGFGPGMSNLLQVLFAGA